MRCLVINGPNLNLLGTREPDVYGSMTLQDLNQRIIEWGSELGVEVATMQSNDEGSLIDAVHQATQDALIINPGAYSHTSRALADALSSVAIPAVEVHISNIREREPWRAESLVSAACVRSIYGRGVVGYRDALRHLVNRAAHDSETVRYGPHSENVGDLRRGDQGLAVLVHGGFWRQEWERDTMESLAVDLTRRGWSTWNIEYRRLGLDGGWPASGHDVLMALDFVPQLGLDVESVSIVGHSAGGQLALWAAPRSVTRVEEVVAMAPLADLEMHAGSSVFGAEEARALLSSGAPRLADPKDVKTLLVHGTEDRHVPISQSRGLADRGRHELMTPELGHFELLDPDRDHWSLVVAELTR